MFKMLFTIICTANFCVNLASQNHGAVGPSPKAPLESCVPGRHLVLICVYRAQKLSTNQTDWQNEHTWEHPSILLGASLLL